MDLINPIILCVLVAALLFLDNLLNSTNIDPYPLPPSEIWNQNLIALGNYNVGFGTFGEHCSCFSLRHFLKYYFCHILSLENLSGDGQMWRSGLQYIFLFQPL
jgi:hypothetical protein